MNPFTSPTHKPTARGSPYRAARGARVLLVALLAALLVVPSALAGDRAGTTLVRARTPSPVLVKDINKVNGYSMPTHLTVLNGMLYFIADDWVSGADLWKSDGTEVGTTRVKDISPGVPEAGVTELTKVNNTLFFAVSTGERDWMENGALWKSDGTPAGTVEIKASATSEMIGLPRLLTSVGDKLFFIANDSWDPDLSLWVSDGTNAGTVKLTTIAARDDYVEPSHMTDVNGVLFFVLYDNGGESFVWKSDGTVAGTQLIELGEPWRYPGGLTNIKNQVFFMMGNSDVDDGPQSSLWRVERNATKAKKLKTSDVGLAEPTAVGSTLFFTVNDWRVSSELWKSDGTTTGTVLVKALNIGPEGAMPDQLTNVSGKLFFSAYDTQYGRELWRSDGSAKRTFRVSDIAPGPQSAWPQEITPLGRGQWMLLAASDGATGMELWLTNGSARATQRLGDIAPGAGSSEPRDFTVIGRRVFFTADDGRTGRELWMVDLR